jgi:deoxycytidylate deaminase
MAAMAKIERYQSLGDELRKESGEYGAVAAYMIREIQKLREGDDEKAKRIYILDSIKHSAEVDLLRHVYADGFCLIGVGCRPDIRRKRLELKFKLDTTTPALDAFIERDAEDSEHDYGQQVNRTFHLADYFVDNTVNQEETRRFILPDKLTDLVEVLLAGRIHRPSNDEKGMYHAHAAAMRSSCLSRQVGASILDAQGNLLSVGTNEVPRFGGGTYDGSSEQDDRCFVNRKLCSNSVNQNKIVRDVYERLNKAQLFKDGTNFAEAEEAIKPTRIKQLIEFSRSVHAEMDAILSLVRAGTKLPTGTTLYSTTYPCHNCARHIVAAGIERVVYLEPYSKSMAIDLHDDSIADNLSADESADKVRFEPYQGVSPSLFKSVYLKTGDLKGKDGKMLNEDEIYSRAKPRASIWTKTYEGSGVSQRYSKRISWLPAECRSHGPGVTVSAASSGIFSNRLRLRICRIS